VRVPERRAGPVGPAPPRVGDARTLDELTAQLSRMRTVSGRSYRDVHRDVLRLRKDRGVAELPSLPTVYRCFQPGRTRLDIDLVADVAQVVLDDRAEAAIWRQAYERVLGDTPDALIVQTSDTLPDDTGNLVGRETHLETVLDLVAERHGHTASILAIEGMAGVGKTALAIRASHLLLRRGQGTDVQFFVDLRGFDPERAPADPSGVLDGFLRALGMAGRRIQSLDLAGRATAFRDHLAGRNALLVLDNATDAEQVRPLLPDSPTCVVLVTSRRRMEELSATHLPLDVLSDADSVALLRRSVGEERIEAEPAAARRIVDLVGSLPLALTVVAARMVATPSWSITDHRDRLVERRESLRLDDGVELALATSYEAMPEVTRRLLGWLALNPGRDFDAYGAAALANTGLDATKPLLEELLSAHLIQSARSGRFALHDLVRVFAGARAREEQSPSARRRAISRLLDYYRQVALDAVGRLSLQKESRLPVLADCGLPTPALERSSAERWLESERANLVALAVDAAAEQSPQPTCDLSMILADYLSTAAHYDEAETLHLAASRVATGKAKGWALNGLGSLSLLQGRHADALDYQQRAIAIARTAGDPLGENRALGDRGVVLKELGRYDEAFQHCQRAIQIARQIDDQVGEACSLNNLGVLCSKLGRYEEAIDHYVRARDITRAVHRDQGGCRTLMNLGNCYTVTGRYDEALRQFEEALTVARFIGDRVGEGRTLENLGCLHGRMGDDVAAFRCHTDAARISREIGDRVCESEALNNLGHASTRLGRPEPALGYHRQALAIAREIGYAEGEIAALLEMGRHHLDADQREQAHDRFREARSTADELGHRLFQAHARAGIARACLALGDVESARVHFQGALSGYTELGTPEADEVTDELERLAQSSSGSRR
jgi:tetratricopeptide (TPR) repeat protein